MCVLPSFFLTGFCPGYFYGYAGFAVVLPWLMIGLTFEFFLGRVIGRKYGGAAKMMRWFPNQAKYIISFKAVSGMRSERLLWPTPQARGTL